jgi:hypothetical protein
MTELEKNFKEIDSIADSMDVINDSISFWEKRMNKCFTKCEEIKSIEWHPDFEEKRDALRKEMIFVLTKIRAENEHLDLLDLKIEELYKAILES